MSTRFLDHGTHFCVINLEEDRTHDHLPVGIYNVRFDAREGKITLDKHGKRFAVPEVRFGDHRKRLEIIRKEYDRLNPSMGILLDGLKGSGKSLFAEDLSNLMIDQEVPVLMIDQKLPAVVLRAVLAMVGPCVCYFDEFGKVYTESSERGELLTVFSDTGLRGVLFIITGNHREEFTDAIYDRPGRFRYRLSFTDLPIEAALEVAKHSHLNERLTLGLVRYVQAYHVSYDMLRAVATMIRGCADDNEVFDHLSIMNVPDWTSRRVILTRVTQNGKIIPVDATSGSIVGDTVHVTLLGGELHDQEIKVSFPIEEVPDSYRLLYSKKVTEGEYEFTYSLGSCAGPVPKVGMDSAVDRIQVMNAVFEDRRKEKNRSEFNEKYRAAVKGDVTPDSDEPEPDAIGKALMFGGRRGSLLVDIPAHTADD